MSWTQQKFLWWWSAFRWIIFREVYKVLTRVCSYTILQHFKMRWDDTTVRAFQVLVVSANRKQADGTLVQTSPIKVHHLQINCRTFIIPLQDKGCEESYCFNNLTWLTATCRPFKTLLWFVALLEGPEVSGLGNSWKANCVTLQASKGAQQDNWSQL